MTVPHQHACVALHGCLRGPLTLVTPSGEAALDSGVFYLLAPGIWHHWRNDGRHTAATLGLLIDAAHPGRWPAGAGVEGSCRTLSRLVNGLHRFSVAGDKELHHSFWLAADHLIAEAPREPTVIAGALLVLLGQVCERLEEWPLAESADNDVARQIGRLLLSRVAERLNINDIAREVCVCPKRPIATTYSKRDSSILLKSCNKPDEHAPLNIAEPSLSSSAAVSIGGITIMLTVHIECVLDCPAEKVWQEVQQSALLLEVIDPLAHIKPVDSVSFPQTWIEGETVRCKSYLFGVIPLGTRTIRLERVDQTAHEIQSRERDPLIDRWDHLIRVEATRDGRTRYSDEVVIEAGVATRLVWLFAQLFYRHRQRKWQRVAQRLAAT